MRKVFGDRAPAVPLQLVSAIEQEDALCLLYVLSAAYHSDGRPGDGDTDESWSEWMLEPQRVGLKATSEGEHQHARGKADYTAVEEVAFAHLTIVAAASLRCVYLEDEGAGPVQQDDRHPEERNGVNWLLENGPCFD